jgi:hypothetical protein
MPRGILSIEELINEDMHPAGDANLVLIVAALLADPLA